MEKYTLEFLSKEFEDHSRIWTEQNEKLKKSAIENGHDWEQNEFDLPTALKIMVKEIIKLKAALNGK